MTQPEGLPFAIAPPAAWLDRRLSLIELRVLLALLSYCKPKDRKVWAHRNDIMGRSGYNAQNVSRGITGLVRKGWVSRKQHRGPNTLEILTPNLETVFSPDTVSDPDTVFGSGINSLQLVHETVFNPETPKQTITDHRTESMSFPSETDLFGSSFEDQEKTKSKGNGKDRIPPCPHLRIIHLYHDTLPELPRIVVSRWKGSKDAAALASRWREDERHRDLEFWQWFFGVVPSNPHWLGQNEHGWKANLRWLVNRTNFDKVLEFAVNHGIDRRADDAQPTA